jgi:hypothetical protein
VKTRLTQAAIVLSVATFAIFARTGDAPADEWGWHHHRHHHAHYVRVGYVEPAPYYPSCRVGWWQTLRYGRVRPQWAEFCR